jgi:hypothetical protein
VSGAYKGDWNSALTYAPMDVVTSESALWSANSANTNVVPALAPAPSQVGSDGGPGSYSVTSSLGMNVSQFAHPIRLNAPVNLGGIRITQHNATAPPATIEVNVLAAAPSGTTFTPIFATATCVPVAAGSNRYDLIFATPMPLAANTDYWVYIRAVGTTFVDMNGHLGGAYTYTGTQIANTASTTTLGRNDAGTWTDFGAGRHIYISVLAAPNQAWERIATEQAAFNGGTITTDMTLQHAGQATLKVKSPDASAVLALEGQVANGITFTVAGVATGSFSASAVAAGLYDPTGKLAISINRTTSAVVVGNSTGTAVCNAPVPAVTDATTKIATTAWVAARSAPVVVLTQAAYDAIVTKDPATVYIIT